MEALAFATSTVPPISIHQKTTEFRAIFGDVLMGFFEPGESIHTLLYDRDGRVPILYWLPHDPERKVVFVTAAPIRNGFSTKYVRWIVTADGNAKAISGAEFADFIKRSQELSRQFSTSPYRKAGH